MTQSKLDVSRASQSIKDHRFVEALSLLEGNLSKDPQHIDSLYLAAVCSRYLKNYKDSQKYLETVLAISPDMGRAYQELGHLNRDSGNENSSITYYRQACELNPALLSSWNSLYNYFTKTKNKPAADHALDQIKTLKSIPANLLYISQILNEGRLGLAETKCREFLKKNPTHTYAMSLLSQRST